MPELIPGHQTAPATAPSAAAGHEIVPEDYFALATLGLPAISPAGGQVAYRESRWVDGERHHHLRVLDVATRRSRRLTPEPTQVFAPQWSPDEETLYFAAPEADETSDLQVWSIRRDGADRSMVTRVPGGVSRFALGASGQAVYYTTHLPASGPDGNDLKERFAGSVRFGDGPRLRTRLWKVEPATGEPALLLDLARYVTSFTVSPDETKVALVTAPDQLMINNEGQSALEIFEVDSGHLERMPDSLWREDAPSPYSWIEEPAWSPDSGRLAFRIGFDSFAPKLVLADLRPPQPVLRNIPRPLECHPLQVAWHPDGRHLVFSAFHRASVSLLAVDVEDPTNHEVLLGGDVMVDAFTIASRTGEIILLKSGPSSLPELHLLKPGGSCTRLTGVHDHTANWTFPTLSRFRWTAPGGTEVEGTLELPHGYTAQDGPLPTLVILHGGPSYAAVMARSFGIRGHTAFAARGYAVFSPNFRGSTGYGDEFLHQLIGRTNDIEIADVLSGIDALVAEGIADGERLGMMGWSYGGYLVNALLATNRFRAASTGAGAVDMVAQFAAMDTPGHTLNLLGSFPWENPDEYRRTSPLYSLEKGIRTATLIHSGSEDQRVPPFHARALHRILHHYHGTPCELMTYQGAGHTLERYEHQLARLTGDHQWFAKHLA